MFQLNPAAEFVAISAARKLGLDIAGVDLLFKNSKGTKFVVCEVNSSPGFNGFEKATKIDVPANFLFFARVRCGLAPHLALTESDDNDGLFFFFFLFFF